MISVNFDIVNMLPVVSGSAKAVQRQHVSDKYLLYL